jgi:3-methyladenine DNA glycosylase AlkD
MGLKELRKELKKEANKEQAANLQRFFKTGKGEYGEGDKFYGIKVPVQRRIAKKHTDISIDDIRELLNSPVHEERLVSLFILVDRYTKGDNKTKENIFSFYLKNTEKINNWDLVDSSAPRIVGAHLLNRDKKILFKLAGSSGLWNKRIAILSTMFFIKNHHFETTFQIAEILLNDKHDLIHKGVGWMLREVGNQNSDEEENFLKKHYRKMPRTMLRYAIEKFPEKRRKDYLRGIV